MFRKYLLIAIALIIAPLAIAKADELYCDCCCPHCDFGDEDCRRCRPKIKCKCRLRPIYRCHARHCRRYVPLTVFNNCRPEMLYCSPPPYYPWEIENEGIQ